MTAGDLAVVLLAVAAVALTVAATVSVLEMRRAANRLGIALDRLDRELTPAVERAEASAEAASSAAARVEDLLDGAEGVVDRVDAASELAYETFSRPVIKAMAVGAGTREAVRRLRRGDEADAG